MTIRRYPSKTFSPCPEGLHQAVCVDVVDLGEQQTQFGIKPLVRVVWQIAEIDPDTDRRFDVIRTCTDSMDKKAKFRGLVEKWRGKKFKEDEAKAFDSDRLLGANCLLQVSHQVSQKTGDTYAVVDAVLPLTRGTPLLAPFDYIRHKDRPKDRTTTGTATAASLAALAPIRATPIVEPLVPSVEDESNNIDFPPSEGL